MNKYWEHFKTITKHRHLVMKLCFKCGYYKRGLLHDLSKYSPIEFSTSARYFQGTRSPIDAEKDELGYSIAWQHHKGHNPHHWEYWIDNVGTRKNNPVKMSYEYVIELVYDWVSAGIVYSKSKCDYNAPYSSPIEYYNSHKDDKIIYPQTLDLIEYFLEIIEMKGVNHFCKIIRTKKCIKNSYTNSSVNVLYYEE